MTFERYVELIESASEGEYVIRGRKSHKIGDVFVSIWRDEDGKPLNGAQYIREYPAILWTWVKPEEFYRRFVDRVPCFTVHSLRYYGQPKLRKPTELKGVKQTFSVDYIAGKCRCAVFVSGDDVWIKHGDYFSVSMTPPAEEMGMPLGYMAKKYVGERSTKSFIYPDAWGDIVLRNEAWLRLPGIMIDIRAGESHRRLVSTIVREQERAHGFGEYALDSSDMERFWERVISELIRTGNELTR